MFRRGLLELNQSKGIDDLGAIKWDIALCLLVVYLICYFSLWKGISTSGKASSLSMPPIAYLKIINPFVLVGSHFQQKQTIYLVY